MAKFNKAERRIAKLLSGFPQIKRWLKFIYSYFNYLVHKKGYDHKSNVGIIELSEKGRESFFGYYDKSPQNPEGYILCNSSDAPTYKNPNPNEPLNITLFSPDDFQNPEYVARTTAYNWQQGARLQWLDADLFIFNDFDSDKKRYIARVFSKSSSQEINRFNFPVQDSFKKDYFLSLNYQRLLTFSSDYGYHNLPPLETGERQNHDNDGIWFVDYKSGKGSLLLSLTKIVTYKAKDIFPGADHYVNHIMIAPGGNHFIFLHRYLVNDRRYDRLMLADRDGQNLSVLADNEMVSHCCWIDQKNILGYLNNSRGEAGFYIINIDNGNFQSYNNGKLDSQGDGHPHACNNWFVCDSYPDKSRMQYLHLNNLKTGEQIHLGDFFHGFKYQGQTRCDLHPRFSPDGQRVFFDSVFSGKRQLYMMDID